MERYGPTVLRVCRAVVGPVAADDAWSETFLSAMQAYPTLRPGSNVEAWLVTIAHRKAIDQVRTQARAVPTDAVPERSSPHGRPGGWESDLWAALKELPLKQRETVAYHYLAGLPYAEIAEIVGGTPDAARRAAADGIAALRRTYLRPPLDQTVDVHTAQGEASMITTSESPAGPDLFAALPTADEAAERRLHARLAAAAAGAGVLDVAFRTVDTPLGPLLLAATDRGLVRVAFASQDHDRVLEQLATAISTRVLRAPARLDLAAHEIEEYFLGRRTVFDLPLDFQLSSGFRRTVLSHLPDIAYGTTASYAAIAAASGSPKAVRAVGTACATNPLPVVVPCHRVVRSDGTLGRYAGGVEAKQTLLTLEASA